MKRSKKFHRVRKALVVVPLTLVGMLVLVLLISALSNLGLPDASRIVERLAEAEKARLAEALHLKNSLGERIWPAWSEAEIPFVVYNEAYVFLVGLQNPQDGWIKVPGGPTRGGPWEIVPGDDFYGQPYYRQPLPAPDITPEAFTVRIGNHWAASLQTKEWMEISLRETIKRDLPAFLRPFVPYRLVVSLLLRGSDGYIAALLHESFHAFQGMQAGERLAQAEGGAARLSNLYPYDEEAFQDAWQVELDLLAEALKTNTIEETARLAALFLDQREARRAQAGLSAQLVEYEQQREWVEGTARSVELGVWREGASPDYQPFPDVSQIGDFNAYAAYPTRWSNEIDQLRRMADSSGDGRFYYSGMAQTVLLDRLLPDWKAQVVPGGVPLEDLLVSALNNLHTNFETVPRPVQVLPWPKTYTNPYQKPTRHFWDLFLAL